jgi:hypothetical protein
MKKTMLAMLTVILAAALVFPGNSELDKETKAVTASVMDYMDGAHDGLVNLSFLLFCMFGAAHVLGEILLIKKIKGAMAIRYITKPFIMPLLAVYYVLAARQVNWWLFAGIIGGFGGDFFLMIPDPGKTRKWFRLGLISFLSGHIFLYRCLHSRGKRVPRIHLVECVAGNPLRVVRGNGISPAYPAYGQDDRSGCHIYRSDCRYGYLCHFLMGRGPGRGDHAFNGRRLNFYDIRCY